MVAAGNTRAYAINPSWLTHLLVPVLPVRDVCHLSSEPSGSSLSASSSSADLSDVSLGEAAYDPSSGYGMGAAGFDLDLLCSDCMLLADPGVMRCM